MTLYFCVFMSANFRNSYHKLKGRISYHNESNQKFWHHTFCVFMSLLPFDFSWSFSKKNLRKSLVAFWCQDSDTMYVILSNWFISWLLWSFSKKMEEHFSFAIPFLNKLWNSSWVSTNSEKKLEGSFVAHNMLITIWCDMQ